MPNYGMDPTLSFPYSSHPPPPPPLSSSPPSHPNHDMMTYYPMSMPHMGMPNGTPTSSPPPPSNASCTHPKMKYEQVSVNGCTFFQPVLDTGLDEKDSGKGSDDPNGVVEDGKKKTKGKQTKKKRKYKKKKNIKKSQSNDVNDVNDVIKSTAEPTVVVTE